MFRCSASTLTHWTFYRKSIDLKTLLKLRGSKRRRIHIVLVWIVEDGKKRIKMKTMTEIWHVIVFVACTYVTSNSTVFERFCVYSRKRIETPVMWTRIDRCISVDRAKIGNGNANAKTAIGISKTTTMHANYSFCTFLCLHSTTTTRNCLISRLVEDLN